MHNTTSYTIDDANMLYIHHPVSQLAGYGRSQAGHGLPTSWPLWAAAISSLPTFETTHTNQFQLVHALMAVNPVICGPKLCF